MVQITTESYLLRMLLDLLCLYSLFFFVVARPMNPNKKKVALLIIFIPVTFFAQLLTEFADIVPVVSSYFVLNTHKGKKINHSLLNSLLLCIITNYFTSLSSFVMINSVVHDSSIKGFVYVLTQICIKIVLLSFLASLYKKFQLNTFIRQHSSESTSLILIYIFVVIQLISYTAHFYQAFDQMVISISLFLLVQTIFVMILFLRISLRQKENFEQKFEEQELEKLKLYTDQLEQNQEKLDKFKHDYKNILLSLKETASINKNGELLTQIGDLEAYSENYVSEADVNFKAVRNIKNSYLKSLIISKLHQAHEKNIMVQFECYESISEISIPIFDCIRVLGIVLDNAIEAAEESESPNISFLVYQDDKQLEFSIKNTYQDRDIHIDNLMKTGVSTKEHHQGIGLSSIQEINKKHKNMFVQFEQKATTFSTQIILTRE